MRKILMPVCDGEKKGVGSHLVVAFAAGMTSDAPSFSFVA